MALSQLNKSWVGTGRRADASVRQPLYWPQAYISLDLDGVEGVAHLSPDSARQLAKALTHNANLIDPPKPRVKRS